MIECLRTRVCSCARALSAMGWCIFRVTDRDRDFFVSFLYSFSFVRSYIDRAYNGHARAHTGALFTLQSSAGQDVARRAGGGSYQAALQAPGNEFNWKQDLGRNREIQLVRFSLV